MENFFALPSIEDRNYVDLDQATATGVEKDTLIRRYVELGSQDILVSKNLSLANE